MTLVLGNGALDRGLNAFASANKIAICSQVPTTYAEANTYTLGNNNFGVGNAFGAIGNHDFGRKVTSTPVSDGPTTANGTPACWAALDDANSQLLGTGSLSNVTPMIIGQTWSLESFNIVLCNGATWTPLAGASIDLDFVDNHVYDTNAVGTAFIDYLSCVRSSTGYVKHADGTLTQVAANTLRIGVGTGLLLEDARTNLIPDSQDFSTTNYGKYDGTVTADSTTAPDGTVTADRWTEGTINDRHPLYSVASSLGTISNGVKYSCSIFVKAGAGTNSRYIALDIRTGTQSNRGIIFDTQTGTITDTNGGLTYSTIIETLANGWYRLTIIVTGDGSGGTVFEVSGSNSATPSYSFGMPSYLGNNSYIFVWGMQAEVADFPSSYIPTGGTSATRAVESVTFIGNLKAILEATSCSEVIDSIHAGVRNSGRMIASQTTNAADIRTDDIAVAGSYLASNILAASFGSGLSFLTGGKVGHAKDGSGRSIVAGGGTVATDANTGVIANPGLSTSITFYPISAYIRRLTAWNYRVDNSTLQSFTVLTVP